MDQSEIFICKVVIYLLANNRTKCNYTYNKLKYLCILYIRKYNELFAKEVNFENEKFKLLLYKMKSKGMINISQEVLMNRVVTTNIRFMEENYTLNELALLNIIIDEYSETSAITLYDLVYKSEKEK